MIYHQKQGLCEENTETARLQRVVNVNDKFICQMPRTIDFLFEKIFLYMGMAKSDLQANIQEQY